jgi:ATP-binding cassette subfamily B protein
VLFNDTVRYNIAYAKPGATDAEVDEAARAAQIHDRILSFPGMFFGLC